MIQTNKQTNKQVFKISEEQLLQFQRRGKKSILIYLLMIVTFFGLHFILSTDLLMNNILLISLLFIIITMPIINLKHLKKLSKDLKSCSIITDNQGIEVHHPGIINKKINWVDLEIKMPNQLIDKSYNSYLQKTHKKGIIFIKKEFMELPDLLEIIEEKINLNK